MSITTDKILEDAVISWLQQAKPSVGTDKIRSLDLIQDRILDSMQLLDFVYFINEVCEADISSRITVDDMRRLPSIVAFVKANRLNRNELP